MYQPLMELTPEQKDILSGKQGESKAKMMECLVRYGDLYQAKRLAPITHGEGHLVTSFGIPMLGTVYSTMDELIKNDCTVKEGFTVDPRPLDYQNVKCNPLEKLVFSKIMYAKQAPYEAQLQKVGLIDKDAFSCTCYLPEMGNTPKEGDVLSWAESSAVVFANSVLGARCNRNSGILELFGSILGYAPEFGFLTDEGRKATWKIVLKTTHRPEAQVLGSAIGMKVMEEVPYVEGLESISQALAGRGHDRLSQGLWRRDRQQWRGWPLPHRWHHPRGQAAGRKGFAQRRREDLRDRRCRARKSLPELSDHVEGQEQEAGQMLYRLPASYLSSIRGLDRQTERPSERERP
jgi:hypothetical protein